MLVHGRCLHAFLEKSAVKLANRPGGMVIQCQCHCRCFDMSVLYSLWLQVSKFQEVTHPLVLETKGVDTSTKVYFALRKFHDQKPIGNQPLKMSKVFQEDAVIDKREISNLRSYPAVEFPQNLPKLGRPCIFVGKTVRKGADTENANVWAFVSCSLYYFLQLQMLSPIVIQAFPSFGPWRRQGWMTSAIWQRFCKGSSVRAAPSHPQAAAAAVWARKNMVSQGCLRHGFYVFFAPGRCGTKIPFGFFVLNSWQGVTDGICHQLNGSTLTNFCSET